MKPPTRETTCERASPGCGVGSWRSTLLLTVICAILCSLSWPNIMNSAFKFADPLTDPLLNLSEFRKNVRSFLQLNDVNIDDPNADMSREVDQRFQFPPREGATAIASGGVASTPIRGIHSTQKEDQ